MMRALKIGGLLLAWVVLLGSFASLGGFAVAQSLPEDAPLLLQTGTLPGTVSKAQAGAIAPPPLPRSCIVGGTPPGDYTQPVCCVSGYVYFGNVPVENASVTVSANGRSFTVKTGYGSRAAPYFSASLDTTLDVRPGQFVTLTVEYGGLFAERRFVAEEGGIQVDVVLPQVDAIWQQAYLVSRARYAMAYDSRHGVIVLFGGDGADMRRLGDTWISTDGRHWIQQTPLIAPSARREHAMAYDEANDVVVLFGGHDAEGNKLGDIWEWHTDTGTWVERKPPDPRPQPRDSHTLVYDARLKRVVLFGGRYSDNGDLTLNDTWEWNSATGQWTEWPTPSALTRRHAHTMVYDSERQRIVLFGGATDSGAGGTLNDVWERFDHQWEYRPSYAGSPPKRTAHAMVYDAANHVTLLLGGCTPQGDPFDDMWAWNGSLWTKFDKVTPWPSARWDAALVYDSAHERAVLVGGWSATGKFLDDTWAWDGNLQQWQLLYGGMSAEPLARQWATLTYLRDGQSLLVGGMIERDNVWHTDTHLWNGSTWEKLTGVMPEARIGHQVARNGDGSQALLCGGTGPAGAYYADTWLWAAGQWSKRASNLPPRAYHALNYDSTRNVWIFFGGTDGVSVYNDLWEYAGSNWNLRHPAVSPPARWGATLTYDPVRQRAVLIGGIDAQGNYLSDVWEWDGANWFEVTPQTGPMPPARGKHSAAYDTAQHVVVIIGGEGATGKLADTWEWQGQSWRPRTALWSAGQVYDAAVTYDVAGQSLVLFGGVDQENRLVQGVYTQTVLGPAGNLPPIATINRITPLDARQGLDVIQFMGSGSDANVTDTIVGYRWTHNNAVIATQAVFTMPAAALPLGVQTVYFEVQDSQGHWSAPVSQRLFIRDGTGATGGQGTWTLLIYAVADNDLAAWMGDYGRANGMLYRLRTAGAQPNVHTAVLYDGPGLGDTALYTLDEHGTWGQAPWESESRMDEPDTLQRFVEWGMQTFHPESNYYALALVDHANGVVGIGQDNSSASMGEPPFLTPLELRSALDAATDSGARCLDVVYYDGCSFGLFENAAIVRGLAQYVVASPNTAWGVFRYDEYRRRAGSAPGPRDYAQSIAAAYAEAVAQLERPYTISVLDMTQFERTNTAISNLGYALAAYTAGSQTRTDQVRRIRDAGQFYHSGVADTLEPGPHDHYVDLLDLAMRVQTNLTP